VLAGRGSDQEIRLANRPRDTGIQERRPVSLPGMSAASAVAPCIG
jgi:hypothetical protein